MLGAAVCCLAVQYTRGEDLLPKIFKLVLGLAGAALATAVSPIISISICSRHFFKKENSVQFVRQRPSARCV